MTKREIILIFAIVVVAVGLVALWFARPAPITQAKPSAPPPSYSFAPASFPAIPDDGSPLSLKTMTPEEANRIYALRIRQDHLYDWKRPINFYGKVVDENKQPVAEATVHLQWNTIDDPSGTKEKQIYSDGDGLFSLTDQRGKGLGVRVEKEGYYTVEGGMGAVNFEFADPSSSEWYESDLNNPVIFHLRKKGEGAKLVSKSLEVPFNNQHPQAHVNLSQGVIRPDGPLIVTSDKSQFLPGAQPFPWTVSLSMTEGGLVETTNQFPFMAPADGYTPSVTIAMTNLDRSVWRGGINKTYYFYLPSTNTYGRLTMDTMATLPFVSLDYVYNPTPGNRVLESASK